MRRAISLSLMMLFSWMLIAPLLAPDAEASLPACCRRNGKHHCMMHGMVRLKAKGSGLASVSEKCPCLPDSTGVIHSAKFLPETARQFYTAVVDQTTSAPETPVSFRITSLRSHQKRGPPSLLA